MRHFQFADKEIQPRVRTRTGFVLWVTGLWRSRAQRNRVGTGRSSGLAPPTAMSPQAPRVFPCVSSVARACGPRDNDSSSGRPGFAIAHHSPPGGGKHGDGREHIPNQGVRAARRALRERGGGRARARPDSRAPGLSAPGKGGCQGDAFASSNRLDRRAPSGGRQSTADEPIIFYKTSVRGVATARAPANENIVVEASRGWTVPLKGTTHITRRLAGL